MVSFEAKIAAIAATQYLMFTREQARAAGGSPGAIRHRLRNRDWKLLAPRLYALPGFRKNWKQRAMAAVLLAGPEAAVTAGAAAVLWKVPGFRTGPVDVVRPRRKHRRTRGHIGIIHETTISFGIHKVEDIPVVHPARALADLAGTITVRALGRAVDNALSMRLLTIDNLVAELRNGRRGSRKLRTVLAERLDEYTPPQGEFGARMRDLIAAAGDIPMPEFEVWLGDHEAPIGRVDAYWRDLQLVAEWDSHRHHTSLSDRRNDLARDLHLSRAGFDVLRITWSDMVLRPAHTLNRLRAALGLPQR